eukprot:scaffold529_cov308-Pinguiococcus_pyrenoidosus.AAC.44
MNAAASPANRRILCHLRRWTLAPLPTDSPGEPTPAHQHLGAASGRLLPAALALSWPRWAEAQILSTSLTLPGPRLLLAAHRSTPAASRLAPLAGAGRNAGGRPVLES